MPQRSSILFWQLLVATFCIDAVVAYWAVETSLHNVEPLYLGLACGQISVAAIGAYFSNTTTVWRWIAPYIVAAAAAVFTVWLTYTPITELYELVGAYMTLWFSQVAAILAVLWILDHTALARLWRPPTSLRPIRFAIKHLLVAMTTFAAFLVACRMAALPEIWLVLIVWTSNNVAIAVAGVIFHALRWHFVLRWAAYIGVVILLAVILHQLFERGDPAGINTYQALILFLWLTIAGIGPKRPQEIYVDSTAQPPIESST